MVTTELSKNNFSIPKHPLICHLILALEQLFNSGDESSRTTSGMNIFRHYLIRIFINTHMKI